MPPKVKVNRSQLAKEQIGFNQGLALPEPVLPPFQPTTILGALVPTDINVQIYDRVSEALTQKIAQFEAQFEAENGKLTKPVRAWDIFIATDRGTIRPAERAGIQLRTGIQVVPSDQGTPSQTIAKAFYTSFLIDSSLTSPGGKRSAAKIPSKGIKADLEKKIQEMESKIAGTQRELLVQMKEVVDPKLEEATNTIEKDKSISRVEKNTLNLLIGANTLVKSGSDAGQNSNAQEWMACSIIDARKKGLMKPRENNLGAFFEICDIVGMANISSDKLSILSSIAATKIYRNPNDHTDGIFNSFCPRKGSGVREAVNIIPAVVWGAARLLSSEASISTTFTELYGRLEDAKMVFNREYTESFRDVKAPLTSSAAGVTPVAPIEFFSHDMWNTYTAYFREIYMCAQTLKQESCQLGASAGSCQQDQEFSISIADSLNIIEERCKDGFLSGGFPSGLLSEDTDYHLNEIFRLNNAFERFYMSNFDALTSTKITTIGSAESTESIETDESYEMENQANAYAYNGTFDFIRSILSCYGRYFTNIGYVLQEQSVDISDFILADQNRVELDTKYLQIAKTWYYHSGLQQYMQMSDEQIAASILEKSKQTMQFMSIDGCLGHDFPFDQLKKTLLDKDIFTAEEIDGITNESDLVVKLLRKLGCISVVSTEGTRGPITIGINTLNPAVNLLTSTETFSSIPIYKICSGIEARCNFTCLNIDYTSIQQVAGIQDLSMIFTLDETLDTMQQFMKETITFVFVTPSTKYDLAAPVHGCFLETGKQSTIFYAKEILGTTDKLVLAFLTYDPAEQAENNLTLRRLGCLTKYVTPHDFYTLEQLAGFFGTGKYGETRDFRILIDQFVENSRTMGVGERGQSANQTLKACNDLLEKFYMQPDSAIRSLLLAIREKECSKILREVGKLFENLNTFRLFSENKKGEVHKKNYKSESVAFLNSLKELIGDSYIKYLSDKISKECFERIQTILRYLLESVGGSSGAAAKGEASMEEVDTDDRVVSIVENRRQSFTAAAAAAAAERTKIIQAFAELGHLNRFQEEEEVEQEGEQVEQDLSDEDLSDEDLSDEDLIDADLEFDLFEHDEALREKDEIIDTAASQVAEETGAVKEKLKELASRFFKKLESTNKLKELKDLLHDVIVKSAAQSIQKRTKVGGKLSRRKQKTSKRKTRKHRKIKYKKYTRAYKLKPKRKTLKRLKK